MKSVTTLNLVMDKYKPLNSTLNPQGKNKQPLKFTSLKYEFLFSFYILHAYPQT